MELKSDLLTIEETAAKLRVNLDTVRRLLRQKKLPGVKIGAQWRVSATALQTYIEGGQASAAAGSKVRTKKAKRKPTAKGK
jgi:excisionase family DNA binding protein